MKKNKGTLWIAAFGYLAGLMIFFFSPVFAAEGPLLTGTFESRHIYESDVTDMSGDVRITESEIGFSYDDKMFGELPVTFSMTVKHIDIVDDVPVDLPSHLEGREFQFSTKFPVPCSNAENYYIGLDIKPLMYTDDWEWKDSAFRIPFRAYVIYKPDETFVFVAGVTIRLDYDEEVLPLFGLIYKPNERLSFNLASDDPTITYKMDDRTTAFLEFDYALDEYEVTRSSQNGVVLKYRQASTGVGLKYEVDQKIDAVLSVGSVFGRRLEYRDDVGKVEPDAALYAKAKFSLRF